MSLTSRSLSSRRVAQRTRTQHLVAVDESALADLHTLVATLPLCATGRVFIEVDRADQICEIEVPARMTVTWLDRSQRSGAPGSGAACGRGQALVRAVQAWSAEMICDDEVPQVTVLADYLTAADIVDELAVVRGLPREAISTPPAYGLTAERDRPC